eukprot:scaffold11360_cov114-Isochrysis_galbana.AAC.13
MSPPPHARQLRSLLKELNQEHLFHNWPAKHSSEDEARFYKQLRELNDSYVPPPSAELHGPDAITHGARLHCRGRSRRRRRHPGCRLALPAPRMMSFKACRCLPAPFPRLARTDAQVSRWAQGVREQRATAPGRIQGGRQPAGGLDTGAACGRDAHLWHKGVRRGGGGWASSPVRWPMRLCA